MIAMTHEQFEKLVKTETGITDEQFEEVIKTATGMTREQLKDFDEAATEKQYIDVGAAIFTKIIEKIEQGELIISANSELAMWFAKALDVTVEDLTDTLH